MSDDSQIFDLSKSNAIAAKFCAKFHGGLVKLGAIESGFLKDDLADIDVSAPIFVCGLARSGTTILLETLAKHDDVASQRYMDFPFVFTPYMWNRFLAMARGKNTQVVERAHKDGLMVSPESPEAMEEPIWDHFFASLHEEGSSSVLDADTHNASFEVFYNNHIKKLLKVRGKSRYLAKGNYHLTRLEYLNKLYREAKFLIPFRKPHGHIASSIKQHKLFIKGQDECPDAVPYLNYIGHFEFGHNRRAIHIDDAETAEIMALWSAGEEVRGWALYWRMTHEYLLDVYSNNDALSRSIKLVSYSEFCQKPAQIGAEIFDFTKLDMSDEIERFLRKNIKAPTYYTSNFSDEETRIIDDICLPTYNKLLGIV